VKTLHVASPQKLLMETFARAAGDVAMLNHRGGGRFTAHGYVFCPCDEEEAADAIPVALNDEERDLWCSEMATAARESGAYAGAIVLVALEHRVGQKAQRVIMCIVEHEDAPEAIGLVGDVREDSEGTVYVGKARKLTKIDGAVTGFIEARNGAARAFPN
jgi:hypothetical protein